MLGWFYDAHKKIRQARWNVGRGKKAASRERITPIAELREQLKAASVCSIDFKN